MPCTKMHARKKRAAAVALAQRLSKNPGKSAEGPKPFCALRVSFVNPSVTAAPRHLPFEKGRHYGRLLGSAASCDCATIQKGAVKKQQKFFSQSLIEQGKRQGKEAKA